MMNTAKKITQKVKTEPVLISIFHKARQEHKISEEMFNLLGWNDLPAELKFEIEEDVKGYADELQGRFSTNCALVQRRRESVDFWVKSFTDGICTLKTAIDALKVKRL